MEKHILPLPQPNIPLAHLRIIESAIQDKLHPVSKLISQTGACRKSKIEYAPGCRKGKRVGTKISIMKEIQHHIRLPDG